MNRSTIPALALLSLPCIALAQTASPSPRQAPECKFPPFANGDGRQNLSDFRGHPVLLMTFAGVWGGTDGARYAADVAKEHAKSGVVVILARVAMGSTFGDSADGIEPGAWLMKNLPGCTARVCGTLNDVWSWTPLDGPERPPEQRMPPYWAVIAPDGTLIRQNNLQKGTKEVETALQVALKQANQGWGSREEAATRVLLYARGALAAARAKAPDSMLAEVEAEFARRRAAVEWLAEDGQWLRAKAEAEALAAATQDVPEWAAAVEALLGRFRSDDAKAELDADTKLRALAKAFETRAPDEASARRVLDLAKKVEGTKVGARAQRLAELVEQASKTRT